MRNGKRYRMVVGSDDAGVHLKDYIRDRLKEDPRVVEVSDFGVADTSDTTPYPIVCIKVAEAVARGEFDRAVLFGGTGLGEAISANKVKGIRAAVCHDVHSAHQSVEHDDVNVMCIGAQIVGAWLAKDLVTAYLEAEFSTDEDFRRRVAKLADMDAAR